MKGFKTIAFGALMVILPPLLTYLAGVKWTDYVSPDLAIAISGVVVVALRVVTTTPVGKAAVLITAGAVLAVMGASPLQAADLPVKASATPYNYPTTKCGMYYGVNTLGSTGAVENAAVGTQIVQGAIGLTLGYTCPMGTIGYSFIDADFDFANLNGSANGFNLTGPAMFEQRFGFGAPVNMIMSLIPGLSSLQNAMPSIMPLPSGVAVVTSNPYLFGAVHEDDVGIANGFGSNREWLISAGFGIGSKTRLSNGVVWDPSVEYILPSTQMCLGPLKTGCTREGNRLMIRSAIEF